MISVLVERQSCVSDIVHLANLPCCVVTLFFLNADNNSNNEEENSNNKLDRDKGKEIEENKKMKSSPRKSSRNASASSTKSSVGELVDSFSDCDFGKKKEIASPFSIGVNDAHFIKGSFEEGGNTLLEIDFLVTGTMEKGTYEGKFDPG